MWIIKFEIQIKEHSWSRFNDAKKALKKLNNELFQMILIFSKGSC